jgi:phosphopentomutase
MHLTLEALATLDRGLLFVNLVDFDMVYGHRNDVAGFARALGRWIAGCPSWRRALPPDDAVFITADHGNDPTTPGTDHTREQVPLLAFGPRSAPRASARARRSPISGRRSPRDWAWRRSPTARASWPRCRGQA